MALEAERARAEEARRARRAVRGAPREARRARRTARGAPGSRGVRRGDGGGGGPARAARGRGRRGARGRRAVVTEERAATAARARGRGWESAAREQVRRGLLGRAPRARSRCRKSWPTVAAYAASLRPGVYEAALPARTARFAYTVGDAFAARVRAGDELQSELAQGHRAAVVPGERRARRRGPTGARRGPRARVRGAVAHRLRDDPARPATATSRRSASRRASSAARRSASRLAAASAAWKRAAERSPAARRPRGCATPRPSLLSELTRCVIIERFLPCPLSSFFPQRLNYYVIKLP